ncbi:MAG: hypothetical protein HLX48_09575 [Halomonas sp.]|uniref:hypothetical protein n=1 Tax=Halomonas sp. TaxID=1486246 RepID=UPI00184A187E|nr:hypothetical protein [Halomonas sp.]NWN83215.1 hypothetical protein [Halomonas sp.]
MRFTHWKPTLLGMLLALGLAGCGNGDEQASDAETPQAAEESTDAEAPATAESEGEAAEERGEEAPVEASGSEEAAPAGEDTTESAPVDAEVSADADTLGESPEATLEGEAALPGEATREDVDAIIEENERRFQEAQQRIDEQFEQAEQQTVAPEPMEGDDADSGIDLDSTLGGGSLSEEEATDSDIDAIIEEQERRFEEAQRELEQQFEDIEREVPEFEGLDTESVDSEASAPASAESAEE